MILERQEESKWGDKILSQISKDLKKEFPSMKGFSKTNLVYMRVFASLYPDFQIGQQPVNQISWSHNMYLMSKCKTNEERFFLLKKQLKMDGQEVLC